MQSLLALDHSIVQGIAAHRTALGIVIAYLASALGSTAAILALSVALALYFALRHRRRLLPFAIAIFGSLASFELMKALVARPRPPAAIALYREPLYSFPSGHAAMAAAFYGFLAFSLARKNPRSRALIWLAAFLLAFLIGFSRVYLGVHYPSDVVAGWLLGGFFAWLGARLVKKRHA
jgi:undecaprenyl-diphosphatase